MEKASEQRTYIAIDLKSFFASVACMDRGLNPLSTNLVVADAERTDKTICLAVTPSLKAYGIAGRARLFEVRRRVKAVNEERLQRAPGHRFTGKSASARELSEHPDWAVDFVTAIPHMARYVEVSAAIYSIYLQYVAPEDIHSYSIDEVFIDATSYLKIYRKSAHDFALELVHKVLEKTGITATAGIGTNLYLCKVAMDIVAKHLPADADGVRIAELDEATYRKTLWGHRPLTDFWRFGRGVAVRLYALGIETMGQLARASMQHEDLLYNVFGVNAEILIDHAWGWEPCTIAAIKAYRPSAHSLSNGQVLSQPYDFRKARVVVQEMAGEMAMRLFEKQLVTDHIALHIRFDTGMLADGKHYEGEIVKDHYGRNTPKPVHGTEKAKAPTSSISTLENLFLQVYDRIVGEDTLIRGINLTVDNVTYSKVSEAKKIEPIQLNLFENSEKRQQEIRTEQAMQQREEKMQKAILSLKQAYGKNTILRGLNFSEGATARQRHSQIGGHKA